MRERVGRSIGSLQERGKGEGEWGGEVGGRVSCRGRGGQSHESERGEREARKREAREREKREGEGLGSEERERG